MADDNTEKRSVSTRKMRRLVARNVRRYRKQKGLTQKELAQRARIDRTHLARFESQGVNVSLDVMFRLAEALDIPAKALLGEAEEVE